MPTPESLVADMQDAYSPEGRATMRNLLADYLRDHPEHAGDVLECLFRQVPNVLGKLLQDGLTLSVYPRTEHLRNRAELMGWDLDVYWHEVLICQTFIALH